MSWVRRQVVAPAERSSLNLAKQTSSGRPSLSISSSFASREIIKAKHTRAAPNATKLSTTTPRRRMWSCISAISRSSFSAITDVGGDKGGAAEDTAPAVAGILLSSPPTVGKLSMYAADASLLAQLFSSPLSPPIAWPVDLDRQ
ncbi:unnamed protein product [Ectocarpus sp. 12 AP-2014]